MAVSKEFFLTPFILRDGHELDPKTVMELRMITASQAIRSKRDWKEKMQNKDIVKRWMEEAILQGIRREEMEYVIQELKYYEELGREGIDVGAIDGVWQADGIVSKALEEEFRKIIYELLEDVEEEKRDYHPGSNGQVVDLVHPSLFCFVKGVTRIRNTAEGEYNNGKSKHNKVTHDNTNYQWLPSEFELDTNGKVTISSYINNLHPTKHKALYPLIGLIFELFVPLFGRVLTDLRNPRKNRISTEGVWYWEYNCPVDDDDPDYDEKWEEWERTREIKWPEVPIFEAPPSQEYVELQGTRLQVIVKLANIELTPENPRYSGGVWHVEGTSEESIVATGIYYYSVENISESQLMFRQGIVDPNYEQHDSRGVEAIYGLKDKDPMNQKLGSVIAEEGRLIAFPNVYQHCVAPFELLDHGKKGHRKIIVFFLVDPCTKVVSTKDVEPQQRDWHLDGTSGFVKPDEPQESTMTIEDAKKYREDLMSERKYIRNEFNEDIYERPFSLCEH